MSPVAERSKVGRVAAPAVASREGSVRNAPWQMVPLGEIGRWFGGGTPSKSNLTYWTNGTIPWVSPKDMKQPLIDDAQDYITEKAVLESSTNMVEVGSVLVVARSGILQHTLPVAITTRRVALNQDIKAVEPRNDVTPEFLALALKAFERQILHTCTKTGTTVQSLELPVFHRFEIPLPSLPEQRRIVAEIEKQFTRLDAGVAALRRVQANLKRYRAAVLKAACEGRLVPTEAELARQQSPKRSSIPRKSDTSDFESGAMLIERSLAERRKMWAGRGSYKDPVLPKRSNLPALPEAWAWASIDQLTADSMIGLDRGRAQQSDNAEVGVPYIKMNNVTMDGRVLFDNMMFVPASNEEAASFGVRDGDILFNTRNSKELVGKVGLVRSPPVAAIFNNNLMRIRVSNCVNPAFLSLQMCSHGFRQRMELVKKATTNIAAVYGKDLWPLPIALPPLAEQTRIVAEVERRLSMVEELETLVQTNLQCATRLRQSILQRAFTGAR